MLRFYLSPHARNRRSKHVVPEWDGVFGVIEDQAEFKIAPGGFRQFPKSAEVARANCRRGLDLKAHDGPALTLHNNVHFILILVSVVVECASFIKPKRLLHDL